MLYVKKSDNYYQKISSKGVKVRISKKEYEKKIKIKIKKGGSTNNMNYDNTVDTNINNEILQSIVDDNGTETITINELLNLDNNNGTGIYQFKNNLSIISEKLIPNINMESYLLTDTTEYECIGTTGMGPCISISVIGRNNQNDECVLFCEHLWDIHKESIDNFFVNIINSVKKHKINGIVPNKLFIYLVGGAIETRELQEDLRVSAEKICSSKKNYKLQVLFFDDELDSNENSLIAKDVAICKNGLFYKIYYENNTTLIPFILNNN